MLGETHDGGDHFPGSIGYETEFWSLIVKSDYVEYSANVAQATSSPWTDIVGFLKLAGNDIRIWDKRCSDAS